MKNKKTINLFILMLGLTSLISCTNDDTMEVMTIYTGNKSVASTRAEDNIPFQWEYTSFWGTDSLSMNKEVSTIIYPVHVDKRRGIMSRSETKNSRRDIPDEGTSDIMISEPNFVYVGAAFPESEFGKNFGKEIISPRNPIEISTNFTDPYMGEINRETGGFGYKKFMKEVLRSEEYKKYIASGTREGLVFQCSEYYSYSDIEKAFSANAGLAKIFSARVQTNSKKTNIKSRLLGQLISKNFSVTMETPSLNGLFKDSSRNTSSDNPVYIRSITYGKIALLSVESEYSFEEVKQAVEAEIKYKILSAGGSYSSKSTEILQKSVITLYVISDNSEGNTDQFFSSLDDIKKTFTLAYSESNIGLPIICKGCYTKDNSVFTMATYTANGRGYNGGSKTVTTYVNNRRYTYDRP